MVLKIEKRPSPNYFSRCGWSPDIFVEHIAEGYYEGTIATLCDRATEVSANFVVGRDGQIANLVPIEYGAWCNGTSIEPNKKTWCGHSTLEAVRARKTNANYYTVSIEYEGFVKNGDEALTEAQFKAAVELHRHIISEVRRLYGKEIPIDREHIVGHREVTPLTRPPAQNGCPGDLFPYDRLMAALKGGEPEEDELEMLRKEVDTLSAEKRQQADEIGRLTDIIEAVRAAVK